MWHYLCMVMPLLTIPIVTEAVSERKGMTFTADKRFLPKNRGAKPGINPIFLSKDMFHGFG